MPNLSIDIRKLGFLLFLFTLVEINYAQWATLAPMPTQRWGASSVELDGKIYVIGGSMPNTTVNEVYDLATNSWETKAPIPFERTYAPIAAVNGKIYVTTTMFGFNFMQIYDPVMDAWKHSCYGG